MYVRLGGFFIMYYDQLNGKISKVIGEPENIFTDFVFKNKLPLGIFETSNGVINLENDCQQELRDGTTIFATTNMSLEGICKTLDSFEQCKTGYHLEVRQFNEDLYGGGICFIVKKNIEVDTTTLENQKKLLEECKKLQDIQFDLVELKEKYQKYTQDLAKHENSLFSLEEMVKDMVKDEEKKKLALEKIKELNNELDELEATIKQDIPSVDKSMDIASYLEKELKK